MLIGCLCAAAAAVEPAVPPHLRDARAMLAGVAPADNHYANGVGTLAWKGEGGADRYVCKATCSAFVTLLVEHAYGLSTEQMRQLTGAARPHAAVWHDAIATTRPGLARVTRVTDVRPGDLLAITFPPEHVGGDTGHVMLVDAVPARRPASRPVVAGTDQWDVVVIDSSMNPHGPADTRRRADGTAKIGLGRGTVRVYANPDGTIAGYAWSDVPASKYWPADGDRHMVVGRLDVRRLPATRPVR